MKNLITRGRVHTFLGYAVAYSIIILGIVSLWNYLQNDKDPLWTVLYALAAMIVLYPAFDYWRGVAMSWLKWLR